MGSYIQEEEPWTLTDFCFGKPLGRGRFGRVYVAKEKRTEYQHLVAIKIMSKNYIKKNKTTENFKRECELHLSLKHPNIISFYGWFHDNNKIYFILEFASGGNLYKLIKSGDRIEEKKAATYILQICWALEYIHSKNIIHRDLKPENILIGSLGEIKIADFGWANQIRNSDIPEENLCHSLVGTLDYLCPEVILREAHSEKVDIWCVGVLCYELLSGQAPFCCDDHSETIERIKMVKYKLPDWFGDNLKELISSILVFNPIERLSIEQIMKSRWIKKNANYNKSYMNFFKY
ncbi:Aurora kinase, partial [Brachionus plicatilis]